jgi:hypothetical protein
MTKFKLNSIIILLSLSFFFSSCSILQDNYSVPAISNPEDAMVWSHNAIEYDKNYGRKWYSAEKILKIRKGVCVQYCTLMHESLNKGNVPNTICWVNSKAGGHYIIKCNGYYYDPTNNWGYGNQDKIKEFCDMSTLDEKSEIDYASAIVRELDNNI